MKGLGWLWAALCLLVSCRPSDKGAPLPRRLNVVLVTIDTLRADRLGCYGHSEIATPNLDRIAQQGALFENAIAQTPLTAPSHASMFTGVYPTVHKVRDTGGFVLQSSYTTLAEILEQKGWDTAAFIGASVLKKGFGLNQGFGVYDDQMPKSGASQMAGEYPERRAGEVVDRAVNWLGSQSGKPFFLWVHVFDPHSPFDPPSPFREKYGARSYDGEVAYTDQQLGRLLEAIARKSAPENTLIVALSDHGESLSEHGEYSHGVFLYDSTLRIAFLMSGPGVPKGLRVKQQVRTIDLLPTVLDLMGGRVPQEAQGTSLVPALQGKEIRASYSYLETLYPKLNMGWAELRGIRTDRWKYIRAPKPELYDLIQDPAETNNVIASHASEVEKLEAQMKAVIGSGGNRGSEKVETNVVDRRTMEQLQSLGYLGGFSQRDYELTGKGTDPKDRVGILKLLYFAVSPDSGPLSPARSVALLRRALSEDPANPTVYLHLSDEYRKAERYEDEMKLYQTGIEKGIRNAWLYSRMGHLYLRQGYKQEAIAAYETAAQLNASDVESLNDLAMAYLDTGKVSDAERVFKWMLAADAQYAAAHNGLGLVAIQQGNQLAARGYFEKAVQLDPNLMEAHLNLGRIYKMMGANTRARACFETFLAKASPAEYSHIIPKVKAELASMR